MTMRMSPALGVGALEERTVRGLTARTAQIEADGFDGVWMGMAWGMDP